VLILEESQSGQNPASPRNVKLLLVRCALNGLFGKFVGPSLNDVGIVAVPRPLERG